MPSTEITYEDIIRLKFEKVVREGWGWTNFDRDPKTNQYTAKPVHIGWNCFKMGYFLGAESQED